MKVAMFENKDENLKIKFLPIPEPKKNEIRIKVIACGVCAGDKLVKSNAFNCVKYPRICGHEIVGVIDKLGDDNGGSGDFKLNDLVGVGWFGGYNCDNCYDCLNGFSNLCKDFAITGMQVDGGYAEYCVSHVNAVVKIPNGMDPIKAAPLLCAGVTVYNSIKNLNLKKNDLVGVLGIGGLGSLGIQFIKAMGLRVFAISSTKEKKDASLKLGAEYFVDLNDTDYLDQIKMLGRVQCIMVTSSLSDLIEPMLQSLSNNGKLLLLSILDKGVIGNSATIVKKNLSIVGWTCGDTKSLQESLEFAKNHNIEPIINLFNLDDANLALESINKAKFRNVIKIN